MSDKESQTQNLETTGGTLPECTRCEAMFRSKELYEAHRKLCFGGKVHIIYIIKIYIIYI